MRARHFLILIIGLTAFLQSCVVRKVASPVSTVNTQLNLTYADMEYVADVTGTSTQSYLLGVIPIGNRTNQFGTFGSTIISSRAEGLLRNRGVNQALYNILKSKNDIDYLMPISYTVEKQVGFLGRKEIVTVRAKAFKIRAK